MPLFLSITGEIVRTTGENSEPVTHDIPVSHLQFFVDVEVKILASSSPQDSENSNAYMPSHMLFGD